MQDYSGVLAPNNSKVVDDTTFFRSTVIDHLARIHETQIATRPVRSREHIQWEHFPANPTTSRPFMPETFALNESIEARLGLLKSHQAASDFLRSLLLLQLDM